MPACQALGCTASLAEGSVDSLLATVLERSSTSHLRLIYEPSPSLPAWFHVSRSKFDLRSSLLTLDIVQTKFDSVLAKPQTSHTLHPPAPESFHRAQSAAGSAPRPAAAREAAGGHRGGGLPSPNTQCRSKDRGG